MELEKEGVTVIWTVEKVSFSNPYPYGEIEFKWPVSESVWGCVRELKDRSEIECVYITKKDDREPHNMSGTVSIIINKEYICNLARFDNHDFRANKAKLITLKTPEAISCRRDLLLPDDTLSIRIHLWDCSNSEVSPVQYSFRGGYLTQDCSFPWILKTEITDGGDCLFLPAYGIEVPRSFIEQKSSEKFSLVIALLNKNSTPEGKMRLIIKDDFNKADSFFMKVKLEIIYGSGESVVLTDEELIASFQTLQEFPVSLSVEELKARRQLYFPDGELLLRCNIAVSFDMDEILETVKYGSDNKYSEWNPDLNPKSVENLSLIDA